MSAERNLFAMVRGRVSWATGWRRSCPETTKRVPRRRSVSRDDEALIAEFAAQLATLSRPAAARQAGTLLSRADAIQRELILAGAVSLPSKTLTDLMSAHIGRYAQANDLATGLAQFATVADDGTVTLGGNLAKLPPGPGEQTVLGMIAQNCVSLGLAEFQKASQSVVVVNAGGLGRYDIATLNLAAQIRARYANDEASHSAAMGIFERLAEAVKWEDAAKAIGIYYAGQPDVDEGWALARLKIRRAIYDEDRLLAARRALGDGRSVTGCRCSSRTLAVAARASQDRSLLKVEAKHDSAVKLLVELMTKYPESPFATLSVEKVIGLSQHYHAYRAIVLIQKYLKDHANDPERVALAYRVVTDRLSHASRRTGQIDLAVVVERHEQFEQARQEVDTFIEANSDEVAWVNVAQLLVVDSYLQEAALIQSISQERASGLHVQAADALHLVGQSFETQAVALAGVTLEKAREDSFVMEQKSAYSRFRMQTDVATARDAAERGQIKREGDANKLALNEASQAWLSGSSHVDNLFCNVTQAELQAETETALQIANRQDRINDAYRSAVEIYAKAASDYPLGDMTDRSLIRVADILETRLKDRAAAMQTYQSIVKLFPGTPVAEDAAWKVAVFYVEESKYAQAVDGFQTFIRNYPASQRVADAQFAMAEVLEQMGKWNDAMDAYEVFQQKFAKHPKVQLASRQITWIKTCRK